MNSLAGKVKPFETTKKLPLSHFPELSLIPIVFQSFAYSKGEWKVLLFDRSIQNKHGIMSHGFLMDSKLDHTGDKFEMDFLANGMETFLVQPIVSAIKLAISSGRIVFVLVNKFLSVFF